MPGILPYPPFRRRRRDGLVELADVGGGANMGIAALSQDLTINGQTVSPTFRYEAKNATTSLWTATVGENLTGAGSGGTVGLDTPLLTDDEAVNGDGMRRWEASGTSFAEVTTEDLVFELVLSADTALSRYVLAKRDSGGVSGYGVIIYNTNILSFYLDAGAPVAQVQANLSRGAFYHVMCFIDRSGSGIVYLNAIAQTPVSVATITSLTSTAPFTMNGLDGAFPADCNTIYAAMWQRDNWLDTHLQAAVAQERFSRLNGSWLSYFSKAPDYSVARNSVATLTKRTYGQVNKQFLVGPYWPRQESIRDQETDRDIDGVVSNSFPYSEDFTQANWVKTRVTIDPSPGVYDHTGKIEMQGVISNAGTNTHFVTISLVPSSNWKHLVSFEFAPGNVDSVRIESQNAMGADVWCQFGLRGDGVVGLQSNNLLAYGIEKLATDRYRCYIVYNGGTSNHSHRFYVIDDETSPSLPYNGDGVTTNLYVTAAQHDYSEQTNGRETLGDYVRTVGVGRTTGKPGTGFLIEGQHTNLFAYSEELDNAAWLKLRASVSADSVEAPDGEITADTLVEDGTAASSHFIYTSPSLVAAQTYCIGIFAKAANRTWLAIQTATGWGSTNTSFFDLSSGTVGTSGHASAGAIDFGNGWFFVYAMQTAAATAAGQTLFIAAEADNDFIFDGLTQDSVYLWGAQITATPYPVSYIKTSGATVTRLRDIMKFGSLTLPTDGTIAGDYFLTSGVTAAHIANVGSSTSNRSTLYVPTANRLGFALASGGVTQTNITGTPSAFVDKWAEGRATYKTDDVKLYENGSQVASDALATMPASMTELYVGGYFTTGFELNGRVRVRLFNKPTLKNPTEFE